MMPANPGSRTNPMDAMKKTAQIALIVILISAVTVLHYRMAHGTLGAHIAHRELYFIPILLSSLWFGLKYGLATSLAVSLVYAPQVFGSGETRSDLWPVVFQVLVFNLVALLVGFLVERGRRQQEKMFAIEKSAALDRAATAVGQELKDLLGSLKTIASLAARSEHTELKQDVTKELVRIEQLVDILFSFKTAGPLQLFSHDLNDIIRKRLRSHRAIAGKNGVSFKADLDAEGCPVRVDTEAIGRMLDRIIQNALEVSTPGQAIHIRSTRRGDRCEVTIADEGPGIKPEHLSKIFKPFFTTKEKGDGLALSSSQKALRDMGGEIHVNSQYGKGATFTVTVPRNTTD
jgi:signal transduction histidine kinase